MEVGAGPRHPTRGNTMRHQVEEVLRRNLDIAGCRVQTDADGEVVAVHVTTRGERAPEDVVADVVTVLAVEARLDIQPEQVHVAILGQGPADPLPGGPEPELAVLEELEHEVRIRLTAVRTTTTEERSSVEVDLAMSESESAVGYAEGRGSMLTLELVAGATLDAVEKLCGGRVSLRLAALHRTPAGAHDVIGVIVHEADGRDVRVHAGAAPSDGDLVRTAVYAALAAMNRRVGRILAGTPRSYRIA
jgi:hypothetical protein